MSEIFSNGSATASMAAPAVWAAAAASASGAQGRTARAGMMIPLEVAFWPAGRRRRQAARR